MHKDFVEGKQICSIYRIKHSQIIYNHKLSQFLTILAISFISRICIIQSFKRRQLLPLVVQDHGLVVKKLLGLGFKWLIF